MIMLVSGLRFREQFNLLAFGVFKLFDIKIYADFILLYNDFK